MSPTRASSGSIPTSLTTPKPRNRRMTALLCGPSCTIRKSNLPTSYCSRISWVICSSWTPSSLDKDMIFHDHSIQALTGSTKVGNTEPCSDTKKRGSENTQCTDCFQWTQASCSLDLLYRIQTFDRTWHTHCLLTLADEHHKIRDIQVSCILRNNRVSFTTSILCFGHSHKCQQAKLFHYSAHYVHSPKTQAFFPSKGSQKH
jgi:hypothetical protein